MKLGDFFKSIKPFASIAASFIPGGTAAVELLNTFLPADKKLPVTATGNEVEKAYNALPPEVKVQIKELEVKESLGLDSGWTSRYTAMVEADGQSTRPQIAKMLAQVMCFEILAFTLWCFVYPEKMNSSVLWTVFASLTTAPAGLLGKYFGELRKEQGQRQGIVQKSIFDFFGSSK